ncbi:MAG: amidohydrolase family protein [Acidobacteriota bacterium]
MRSCNHLRCFILRAVATCFFCVFAPGQIPGQGDKPTAVTGGTVLTMAGETIEKGIVLISGGKIAEVGRSVKIPPAAAVIDATGKYVMPGIVDAMTYFGIRQFDLNDPERPSTPENKIIRAYYVFGEFYEGKGGIQPDPEILSGGVTTVYIAPGDKQVIGGQGAVVKTAGRTFEGLILREPAAIDMALGDPPKRPPAERKSPSTRMGVATTLRKALLDAQEYERKLQAYEAKSEEDRKKSLPPPRDLGGEALLQLLHREIPARVECDFVDDIRTGLRIAKEFNLDLIIDSGVGAHKVRAELAAMKIPVVLGPQTHPYIMGGEVSMTPDLERESNAYNASLLKEAGVKIALASFGFPFGSFGGAVQGKWLLVEAAYLAGFGLSDEEVLRAITIHPAEILGVADRVGSLERGKDADLLILSGYPLNIKSRVEQVFVDGARVFPREPAP